MAATGFTPIQLYRTSTASAVPTSGNLADGELAINLTDERLYFKNAAGTVKLLAANVTPVANGGTGSTTLTANNVLLGNGTSALQVVAPGTAGNVLTSNGTTWTSAAVAATLSGITQSVSPFETALGHQAGNVTTGANNTWVGYQAGLLNTTGASNTAVGFQALDANTTGGNIVAMGSNALGANTTGIDNTAVGSSALFANTVGEKNTAVGQSALSSNTGSENTALGHWSLLNQTSGTANVAVGVFAGRSVTTGTQNTLIGYQAGYPFVNNLTTGSNNIIIGYNAEASSATVSNEVTIGNASIATFRIPGLSVSWTSSTVPNVSTAATQTLTNKRITPRIVSIADAATITPTGDTADQYVVTALAQAATIATPSGTPTDGQKLTIRIEDNGTARALTWTTSSGAYRAVGATLPTTTNASKALYVGCIYNSQDVFWDVVAVAQQA
jgi:hypothetical protein